MGVHGGYKKLPKEFANRYMQRKGIDIKKQQEITSKRKEVFFKHTHSNKEEFDKWVQVSTNQQEESTIRELLLKDQDLVCITYLCRYQKFDERFIEELYWLTNRFFDKDNYRSEIIQLIIQFTDEFTNDSERIRVLERITKDAKKEYLYPALSEAESKYRALGEVKTNKNKCLAESMIPVFYESKDRLDWRELNNWDLSSKFRDKYKKELDAAKLLINNAERDFNSMYRTSSPNLL